MIQIHPIHPYYTPSQSTAGSGGLDLYARESVTVPTGGRDLIPVGFSVAIPDGYVGLVWPRSGKAVKEGLDTGAGVIDSDYRGEVHVLLFNHSEVPRYVRVGERIAQMVVVPCMTDYTVVHELPEPCTEHTGFGSTGR